MQGVSLSTFLLCDRLECFLLFFCVKIAISMVRSNLDDGTPFNLIFIFKETQVLGLLCLL